MAEYDILLIGDGTDLLRTISWVLEYKGFAVKGTASLEAALEALVRKNYDLVLAKLTPDDLEGLDILKRAKRLNPAVKVMVISSNNDAAFPLEAYELDVDDYLLMPVSPTELWRRVRHCLEGRVVVELQAVQGAPVGSGDGPRGEPQMMLMLHDIRESLVSIAASMKLMTRGFYGEMSETAMAKLQEVNGRVEEMGQLTEDMMGKALVEHRSEDRDVVDITEDVVEPVLAELAPEIQNRQITLVNRLGHQPEGKITVRGGKSWLKSVFRNLVNNSIKYGGRGCTIVVDLECDGSNCRLNVYNSGETVPEACRPLLFSYGRGGMRRSNKSRQGLGLGLSLSRDLIQNQGGDIWYEAKNDGSNFVVSLPQH